MKFKVIQKGYHIPTGTSNTIYLRIDNWDDFSFRTTFHVIVTDNDGSSYDLGNVKIGYKDQTIEKDTHQTLLPEFNSFDSGYFSLGTSLDYYNNLMSLPSEKLREKILEKLNDVVFSSEKLSIAMNEPVFKKSLLRDININTIYGQFTRVLKNQAILTPYDFSFIREASKKFSEIELSFEVEPLSTPPTNVHAIIGRNGVGKTTLLNEMINCILDSSKENSSYFIDNDSLFSQKKINKTYFSSIISISFSAFDPFNPPQEQPDPTKGTCYFYLGLKKTAGDVGVSQLRTIDELREECVSSLIVCFSDKIKKGRWMKAISTLESDNNFLAMNLSELFEISDDKELRSKFMRLLRKMSSGHAIVLLTITKLVEKAEEKTLVLIDEPESHLHPPLLSAFTRALSDLLIDRNGVSTIATHSPVLLQEIPKMCTWVINRYGKQISVARPTIETFGENVGLLTREVFRLEVENSGYHSLLKKHVDNGECFNEIMAKYKNKIGLEGQALLRTMISLHQKDEGEE